MKKITFIFFLLIGVQVYSQKIFIETGKTASSFEYIDSNGVSLKNLQPTTNNYLGIGFKKQIFTQNLDLQCSLTYNSYGAKASDTAINKYFEWNTDYLGINIGLDYNLFKINKFIFYLKALTSMEFIVQGNQKINNSIYNIVGVEEFDNPAIFFKGGTGISYPINEKSAIYFQYVYGKSLALKDNSNSSSAELKINSNMIGIGILVTH